MSCSTWKECQEQVHKFGGAKFKSFVCLEEAAEFANGARPSAKTKRWDGCLTAESVEL